MLIFPPTVICRAFSFVIATATASEAWQEAGSNPALLWIASACKQASQ